jgi:hypothetical protein
MLPLFVLTGASGAGKSTVCLRLPSHLPECVVLESDILWRPEFDDPDSDYHAYRNLWLRVAKNISQSGRPVVLCGSAVPAQFEGCPERRYLGALHTLALVCDDAELARRLRGRPGWRGSSDEGTMARMLAFNQWLVANGSSAERPMALLDTTHLGIEETTRRTAAWARALLTDPPLRGST